jgi:hypothetical protein
MTVATLTAIGPALFAARVPVAAALKSGARGTTEAWVSEQRS